MVLYHLQCLAFRALSQDNSSGDVQQSCPVGVKIYCSHSKCTTITPDPFIWYFPPPLYGAVCPCLFILLSVNNLKWIEEDNNGNDNDKKIMIIVIHNNYLDRVAMHFSY